MKEAAGRQTVRPHPCQAWDGDDRVRVGKAASAQQSAGFRRLAQATQYDGLCGGQLPAGAQQPTAVASARAGGQEGGPVPGDSQQDPAQQQRRHGEAALCIAAQLPDLSADPGLQGREVGNSAPPTTGYCSLPIPIPSPPYLHPPLRRQPCRAPLPLVRRKGLGGYDCLPQQRQQQSQTDCRAQGRKRREM